MSRKFQRQFLSGKHTKAYLILGIFPLVVFILLFAKLNFKIAFVDEEFFSSIDGETLESALMTNIRIHRHVIRKSHDTNKRLNSMSEEQSEKLKKRDIDFGMHNNGFQKLDDEKQAQEFEKRDTKYEIPKNSETMKLGPLDVTSPLSNERDNRNNSQNIQLTKNPTHFENKNFKKPKAVANESKKRPYASQNYNSHTRTQIEKPVHFQEHLRPHPSEKPMLLQKSGYSPTTGKNEKVNTTEIYKENEQVQIKVKSKTQQKPSKLTNNKGQVKTPGKTEKIVQEKTINKKEIIHTHSGLLIEIPEELQCSETKKTKMLRLLPQRYLNLNETKNRIFEQMDHVPTSVNDAKPKLIYWYGNEDVWSIPEGNSFFQQCKVKNCIATYDKSQVPFADAVVLGNQGQLPRHPPFQKKSHNQIWAFSMIETPPNTKSLKPYRGLFNWTLTYRQDSVIPTPYFKFRYFPNSSKLPSMPTRNYAEGKTKKVAIFVSNCYFVSSGRMRYVRSLAKHIDVDIFGRCGKYKCSKKDNSKCLEILKKDYKFYLAFENSKCEGYMTEKVTKASQNDVIPIVLGASRELYKQAMPPGSYIHTEDFLTPKDLAEFLHKLDQDDSLYNEYFRWKQQGEFINIQTWCRMCSLLNEELLPRVWYDDIEKWWRPDNVCIGDRNWPH